MTIKEVFKEIVKTVNLNKIGTVKVENGKRKCYVNIDKVSIPDKNVKNKKRLVIPKKYSNYDDVTYVFDRIYLYDVVEIDAYNDICDPKYDNKTFKVEIKNCDFATDSICIMANNIKLERNDYGLFDKQITIFANSVNFKNECSDNYAAKIKVRFAGESNKKVSFTDCQFDIDTINVFYDDEDNDFWDAFVINIEDSMLRAKDFKAKFNRMNVIDSSVDSSNEITLESIWNHHFESTLFIEDSTMDAKSIKLYCNKVRSNDSAVAADTIDIKTSSTELENSQFMSNHTSVSSPNITITSNEKNSIYASKGLFIDTKDTLNKDDVNAPTIIYNGSPVEEINKNDGADISVIKSRKDLINVLGTVRDTIINDISDKLDKHKEVLKNEYTVSEFFIDGNYDELTITHQKTNTKK